ncbi:MAG TPA: Clp protease N-terminal domain-containing protein [Anaerolineae bacterium]|nr:Clp protease N-terminal domain-containing protein [Anaerolineae bacterium]
MAKFDDSRQTVHKILAQARTEARGLGSPRVEAEHLLLALAALIHMPAGQLLAAEGLNHDVILKALDLEFERSLEGVNIHLNGFFLPESKMPILGELRLAQSAKLAIVRANKARVSRRDHRFDSLHMLLGVLNAESGVVPRALIAAGIDRAALITQALAALDRAA